MGARKKEQAKMPKNICILTGGGWQDLTAWDPCDIFRGKAADLSAFVEKQQKAGNLALGYIPYGKDSENVLFYAYDKYKQGIANTLLKQTEKNEKLLDKPFAPIWPRSEYDKAFRKIKNYIANGHIYQINLTHPLEAESSQNGRTLFARLAANNTAPMMGYLESEDLELISMSPERFVQIDGRHIETSPIKGTRARGNTEVEDQKNTSELTGSTKEKAELNMITDLLRNDLGKVCKVGTVKVEKEREIQKLTNVIHTYSKISGELVDTITPIEALISLTPGGSITGCPKIRAMEIIDELEPFNRGAYCGNMVVVYPDGRLDSSILIRTIIKKGRKLTLPVGGGIVFDSVVEKEYQETLDKAEALIRALS